MSNNNLKVACVKGLAVIGAVCVAAPVLAGIGMSIAPVLSVKALAVGAAYCTTAVATPIIAAASAAACVAWAMGIIEPLSGPDSADKGAALMTGPLVMIPVAILAGILSLPFAIGAGSAAATAVASML